MKELWADSTVSLRGISRDLGIDPTTVKLHAAALELPFPRQGERQTNRSNRELVSSSENRERVPANTLENYRAEWLAARRENPISGRTKLKNQFQRVYTWLRRNDREWLEANLPPKQQLNLPSPRVNWGDREALLHESGKVSSFHNELVN